MAGAQDRPAAPDRTARPRRGLRGRGVLRAAPGGGVRGVPARHRTHQAGGADLEAGVARLRRGPVGDGFVRRDLAIDLGTANTLVFREGDGIVFNEPTVIAMNSRTAEVLAMGEEAWDMIGRTPANVVAVRPLRHGAITDFDITQRMIRLILKRVGISRLAKPRVLVCVPSAITEVERRAVEEAAQSAGARDVALVDEPLAAAIGAGLPIHEPVGNLVVDIGGGTSEMAVISMGGVVTGKALRIGGFEMDAAIQQHVRRAYGMAIGERNAAGIQMAIGSALPPPPPGAAGGRGARLAAPHAK